MRLILDRMERTQDGKIIAVFEGDTASYVINEANIPKDFIDLLEIGVIIEAEIVEDKLVSPQFLDKETEKKRAEMKNRLSNLFNRNKKT